MPGDFSYLNRLPDFKQRSNALQKSFELEAPEPSPGVSQLFVGLAALRVPWRFQFVMGIPMTLTGMIMCSRQRAWRIAPLMSTSSYEANDEEGRQLWVWNSPPPASLHHLWPPGCLVLQMWFCYVSKPLSGTLDNYKDASEGGCPDLQGLLLGYRIITLPSCFWEGGFPRLLARAEQGWLNVLAAKQLTSARGGIRLGVLVSLCPDDSTRERKFSVWAELLLRNQETCLWHWFQDSGETLFPFWTSFFPSAKWENDLSAILQGKSFSHSNLVLGKGCNSPTCWGAASQLDQERL